jgi:DNA-binding FrmR family transcriptional regulator
VVIMTPEPAAVAALATGATGANGATAAAPAPSHAPMTLDPTRMGPAVERLESASAQIGEILALIEQGEGCAEIVSGLAQVSATLDRVGFGVIALGLRQCAANPDSQEMDRATMERLFLTLT